MENSKAGNRKTIKDIVRVSLSNIIKLLAGILVGFLLPKIVGVNDYGYYKTFTLYATYVGMFHFGFSDGIYLQYGGKAYDELERTSFRFYSRFLIALELVISIVLAIISLVTLSGEYRFVFVCLSFFLVANNVTGYYQVISQITSRFGELSSRNIIQSILISLAVVGLWLVTKFSHQTITYREFTVIYVLIFLALAVWYVWTYREITVGKAVENRLVWRDVPKFIKLGFPLMIANLCSSLILTLDRQFVNILFDNETYAVYAFAYNMLSLITTAMAAISTVLYPKLKQTDEEVLKKSYSKLIAAILCMVFACMVIYYPLCAFVSWFLPKYIDSLIIFRVIFPGLAISSAITIIMHNYYKTLGATFNYFIKSIVILVVSGVFNYAAYAIFKTTVSISVASIITMLIWYVYVEHFFIRQFNVKWVRNFLYMVILMAGFYGITLLDNQIISCVLYVALYVTVTIAFYREYAEKFLDIVKRKLHLKK